MKNSTKRAYSGVATAATMLMIPFESFGAYIDMNIGGNVIEGIYSFDWNPSSSVSIGNVGGDVQDGDIITNYIHGSLGSFLNSDGNPITDNFGLNSDYEITFTASFESIIFGVNQSVNPVSGNVSQSLNFVSTSTPINNFEIWIDYNPSSNPLEGTGFNTGSLLAAGTVTPGGTGTMLSTFAFSGDVNNPISTNPDDYQLLDQFGVDDWDDTRTNAGIGGAEFTAMSSFFDTNVITPWSLDGAWGADQLGFSFNSSQKVAFSETNPSRQFVDENGNVYVPDVGTINGINGAGVLLQVDGNTSFDLVRTPPPVPEPGIIALFGAGLLGMFGIFGFRKTQD